MLRERALQRWTHSIRSIFLTLRTVSPAAWFAICAFFVLTLLPVFFLGAMWLISALEGDQQALALATPSLRSLQLLGRSLLLAITTAALAAVLGTSLAIWTCGEGRWQRLIRSLYLIPLLIPAYIHVFTWLAVMGRGQVLDRTLSWIFGPERLMPGAYEFWPTALVLTLATFPVVTLLVRNVLKAIDPEFIEAASLVKAPWPIAYRIVVPLVMPAILAGAGLVFVLALVQYGVPSMFEYRVYVMEIYASFSQDFNAVNAFAVSVPLMVLTTFTLALSQSRMRNNPLRGQHDSSLRLVTSKWPRSARALLILSVVIWIIACVVPISVLLARSGIPSSFTAAISPAWGELARTVLIAIICGIVAAAVVLPLATLLTRLTKAWKLGWFVCALPLAIPAPVIGIALIFIWNRSLLAWGYGTPLMLVIAHLALFLPFGIYAAASQVRHIDPIFDEAASLPAVGWWRRYFWVRLPMIAPAIVITFLIVFVLSLGELGASLLISPPGEATLPMRIYNLLHYGATSTVSALALIMLVIAALVCAIILILRRRLWGGIA